MTIHEISNGNWVANINSVGASLVGLRDGDFHLVEPHTRSGLYAGSVLAPWPNRLSNGKYSYRGRNFTVPINESSRNNAIHGLVAEVSWLVSRRTQSSITFEYKLNSPKVYPGILNLFAHYKLSNYTCEIKIEAKNIGKYPAPYGVSIHTYFVIGKPQKNNQIFLTLPCSKYVKVDKKRLLPIRICSVMDTQYNFLLSRRIANLSIDHAFKYSTGYPKSVILKDHTGAGIALHFDRETQWIQVHTADRCLGPDSRMAIAIEPMTCPPDAFNSGLNLIDLAPKQRHTLKLKIQRYQD